MKCNELQEKENVNLQLKNKKKQKLKEKGITLIALVVTIIILLILAGVTLNMALSGDGLFSKARQAADEYNQKAIEEKLQLMYAERIMEDSENNLNGKPDVTDLLEETIEGQITDKDIEEFNEYLEPFGEKIVSISTVDNLAKIGIDEENYPLDGIYVQTQDLNITAHTPIGTEEKPFTGVYNGNGYKIKNPEIKEVDDSYKYCGLFGYNTGTIKKVAIVVDDNKTLDLKGQYAGSIVRSQQ